jgi:hypothetical protein
VSAFLLILCVLMLINIRRPGFFSRLKEKGAVAKDAWGVIGSAYVVDSSFLARLNEHGIVSVYNK